MTDIFSESQIINLGIAYLNQKNYELATQEFNKVLQINPKNETAHAKLGYIYLQQKNLSQAIDQFNRALELNPQAIDPHLGLGFCYFELGRIEEALDKFNYVLKSGVNNEHIHFGFGLCYLQKKELDKANEEFNQVLKINPRSEVACENLLHVYYQQRKYVLVREMANRLLGINPSSVTLYQILGTVCLEEENYPQALAYFQKVLELSSKDSVPQRKSIVDAYINIGRTYLLMREYELAIRNLEKARQINPDDNRINDFISKAYLGIGDYDLAVDTLMLSEDYNAVDIASKKSFIKDTIAHKQGSQRIKILRIPNFYGPEILSTEMNSIMLPPLALGSIVSYIRSQGIHIDQDDLHIKIHYDNYFSGNQEDKIDEAVFFDERRVVEYTKGNSDSTIDKIMEQASHKTTLEGYKIILFSLDNCSKNFSHLMFALCFAKYLKRKYNPIIILGGLPYFPELMQKIGCTWSDIDYVICREGEEVLAQLLSFLLGDSSSEVKTIIKLDRKVIYAEKVPQPVEPDFDGLPLERYRYRGLKTDYCQDKKLKELIKEFNISQTFLLPFRFTKGCTNRCIFCASSYGGLIHVVNPKTVAAWLEELQARYNPTGYLFLNDTLNISKKYLNQLCDEIIKRNLKIRWSDCVRVDRLDKESIYKMRDAGCVRMVFGMETASKKLLNYINKDIDLKRLEEMLYWSDKAGIWTGIETISGLPYESEKDIEETISFLKYNIDHIDALYYNAFNIKDTSLLRTYSDRYGITNIFEMSNYEESFSSFVKYGFDEAKGLKWLEKRKQIIYSFNKIMENFGSPPFPEHEYEHFLFFLYSKYSDKKTIRTLFYSVGNKKTRYLDALYKRKTFPHSFKRATERTLIYGGR